MMLFCPKKILVDQLGNMLLYLPHITREPNLNRDNIQRASEDSLKPLLFGNLKKIDTLPVKLLAEF
jgi:hypothetical protein